MNHNFADREKPTDGEVLDRQMPWEKPELITTDIDQTLSGGALLSESNDGQLFS